MWGEQLWLGDRGGRILTPVLLYDTLGLIPDEGRGLALRMSAAVRSRWAAIALAER